MTAQQIRNVIVEDVTLPLTQLQKAILLADAPVLEEEDVYRFQASRQFRQACRTVIGLLFLVLLGLAVVVPCAVGLYRSSLDYSSRAELYDFVGAVLYACGAVMGLPLVVGSLSHLLSRRPEDRFAVWFCGTYIPGTDWHGLMPLPIQRRARAIEEACPGAGFSVEYLGSDPFLIAAVPGERYYVGVWDEKGFVR